MTFSREQCDLLGALVAISAFLLADAVFISRMLKNPEAEWLFGLLLLMLLVPLTYLMISTLYLPRPPIYLGWIGLFMIYLVVELLLDYVFKVPFREVRWQAILYVMLFFGALGGMIGVASLAGRRWGIAAIVGFLSTTVLAFVQHRQTGL
jgi:hypothetical protein